MLLAAENTRFCQRSATPGWRASSEAISWYPISFGINAKTQRPIPKDANRAPFGRLRTTDIDYAHATLTLIELQYIRAIRSFLLVSNLGCRGVNRRCTRDTGKTSQRFALIASRTLVNSGSLELVNFRSTKMIRKSRRRYFRCRIITGSRDAKVAWLNYQTVIPGRASSANPESRDSQMCHCTSQFALTRAPE